MLGAFKVLARLKGLRGTMFDPFGRTQERRAERAAIEQYFAEVDELCAGLSPETHAISVAIAKLPLQVRGFGHVKHAAAERVELRHSWTTSGNFLRNARATRSAHQRGSLKWSQLITRSNSEAGASLRP